MVRIMAAKKTKGAKAAPAKKTTKTKAPAKPAPKAKAAPKKTPATKASLPRASAPKLGKGAAKAPKKASAKPSPDARPPAEPAAVVKKPNRPAKANPMPKVLPPKTIVVATPEPPPKPKATISRPKAIAMAKAFFDANLGKGELYTPRASRVRLGNISDRAGVITIAFCHDAREDDESNTLLTELGPKCVRALVAAHPQLAAFELESLTIRM